MLKFVEYRKNEAKCSIILLPRQCLTGMKASFSLYDEKFDDFFIINIIFPIFFASTYNKQWSEANNALVDLLEFEIPKEERKHEKVRMLGEKIKPRDCLADCRLWQSQTCFFVKFYMPQAREGVSG